MSMECATCINCGLTFKVDSDDNIFTCENCGATILVKDAIKEFLDNKVENLTNSNASNLSMSDEDDEEDEEENISGVYLEVGDFINIGEDVEVIIGKYLDDGTIVEVDEEDEDEDEDGEYVECTTINGSSLHEIVENENHVRGVYLKERIFAPFDEEDEDYKPNTAADSLFNSAEVSFKKLEHLDAAEDLFLRMTKLYPEDYRGWLGVARVLSNDFTDIPSLSDVRYDYNVEDYYNKYFEIKKYAEDSLKIMPEDELKEFKEKIVNYEQAYLKELKEDIDCRKKESSDLKVENEKLGEKRDRTYEIKEKKKDLYFKARSKNSNTSDALERIPFIVFLIVLFMIGCLLFKQKFLALLSLIAILFCIFMLPKIIKKKQKENEEHAEKIYNEYSEILDNLRSDIINNNNKISMNDKIVNCFDERI